MIIQNWIVMLEQISNGHFICLLKLYDEKLINQTNSYIWSFQANSVLSSKHGLAPHVLFALDNVIRRVIEQLVGLIRPG